MNDKCREYIERKDDLRSALSSVRQACQILPQDMEGLLEDLHWVEESMEEAIDGLDSELGAIEDGGSDFYTDQASDILMGGMYL